MRRGLMAWDPAELPEQALRARVARVQAALAAAEQDALIVYTNFVRSAAVGWLTAFSPYWADGMLMVPRDGEPVFATTMAHRVATWVQSVKPVGELVHAFTPGTVLAQRLAGSRCVAVLELDRFPGGLYDEIAGNLPGVAIVDGTASFTAARGVPDATELAILAHADGIAQAALNEANPLAMGNAGSLCAAVEQHARLAGAEECYMAIAPDLDADPRFGRLSGRTAIGQRCAIRATVAYKGSWVRGVRTVSRDPADAGPLAAADTWFARLRAQLDPSQPVAGQLGGLPGAETAAIVLEAAIGTAPLAPLTEASARGRAGMTLTLRLPVDGRSWIGAGLIGA